MKTCVIAIGNTDNKLTQQQWAAYCADMEDFVDRYGTHTFAKTYAVSNSQYQNAVYVFSAEDDTVPFIRSRLSTAALSYGQESIALMVGDTEMVEPPASKGIEEEREIGAYTDGDDNTVTAIEVQHGIAPRIPHPRNSSRRWRKGR